MKIIGGRLRGLGLTPFGGGRRNSLRPTSARARTVVFDLLKHGAVGDCVTDAHVLDLFAGTGALALEAISRGAASAVLVDKAVEAGSVIQSNIARAGLVEQVRWVRQDATRLRRNIGQKASLVFLDPPYDSGFGERAVISALGNGWMKDKAIVVAEDSKMLRMPDILAPIAERRIGSAFVTVSVLSIKVTEKEPCD